MASPIAILNAEQYSGIHTIGKSSKMRKAHQPSVDDGPRKKAKTSSMGTAATVEDQDGGDEKGRKARGRPRLDTKDQTAVDRRRTQIRLAQRAYRSRKENAIQSLEKNVQDLQETNEEMTNAFMRLHDYAVNHGIVRMAPEFARELQLTTEKFLSLTRRSCERSGNESLERDSEDSSNSPEHHIEDTSSSETLDVSHFSSNIKNTNNNDGNNNTTVLGYEVMNEAELDHALSMADLSMPDGQIATSQAPPLGFDEEVPTMSSLDSTNFTFDVSATFPDFFTGTSTNPNLVPQRSSTPTISPPPLSPFLYSLSLSTPDSLAFNEITFGRRLQRHALERGYQLITMPNPPKDAFARIFGFCMLFESVDQIRERIARGLARSTAESLNYWAAPFWALGGTGQRSFAGSTAAGPNVRGGKLPLPGNRGTEDVGKHAFATSFGLGPFDANTTDARDKRVDGKMRIMLPGFQGEFFDADEVELYLRSRGVVIQPGQDYVTVEVDEEWFKEGRQGSFDVQAAYDQWASLSPNSGSPSLSAVPTVTADDRPWDVGDGLSDSIFEEAASFMGFPGNGHAARKLVTLDIDKFVRELVDRGVCLGRAPGFRPSDVYHAFCIAIKSDDVL
ncbi:hypothetical protein M406DRAFT_74639 [Cryphonectria parasitica EP155]|uniref:BZIP domain-containing protein n=1 Tax=Cryphonectria parasitica (strain ATCC 38755 / EP155) TaxID=660469 RepID=A0A9P4XVP5_CRYP1|nr:uncharacterized protein M406DRAFT_74639 [Cryphonectria parasitica EP155]KAF3761696.1 hypothetical protein M406DRAFT_74639 [Cryphonectria parasitica EP155]